ncbi:hypothetical protein ABZX77_49370 [Streptomyces sp. NPDC004237]|uniref:hypothetical protein n=2 Tax=unclassified Streptomyces TaxID=2593676 RepID=UPI0033BF54E2
MPNTFQKRMAGPVLAVLSVLTAGTMLVGCSSDSKSTDASDDSQGSSNSSSGSSNSAVAYSQCMRDNGVSNYPDPKEDSQGRVQLTVPADVDQNSPTFKSAQSACQSKLVQGDTGAAANSRSFDATKVAAWAKCIRKNGMPNFQDPKVDGSTIIIDADAAGISGQNDPNFAKATAACYSIRPGGSLMVTGGGQ